MKQTNTKMSDCDRVIFDRILATAKKKKISLAKLSKAINKSQNYLNSIKNNGRSVPCSLVFQIADILDVDPVYLLTGKQNGNQEKLLREKFSKAILDRKTLPYDDLCALYGQYRIITTYQNSI